MAKDNRITIEILTDDKGTAKKATLKQKDLQNQVKKTGDALKKTGKQAQDFNKKEKALYQNNLSTAKGFSKMKETMGSGSSGLVGAYATLAANVFAATAAFNALRGAAQVQTLIEGFTFLGNAAGQTSMQIAQGIREITDGAVSLEIALRSSAIALTSGFNTNQIAELAEVAKNASIALGRNMADSMDRLFRGVAKLEPEILDELGIMVRLDTAVTKYAAQLGKSATALTDFERRQAFLNETLTQGALKYGDLSGRIDPNPYDKLASAFADLTEKGLNLINNVLSPFLLMLSTNQASLVGGLVLFGSTILTTMIPALGQFAEKQAAVARTARDLADSQAKAGKQAAQTAKIDFVRGGGSAALTTKGGDFARVADLKKDLKSGKANAQSFNKALQQVQNTRKRTATLAKKNGTAQTKAHLNRMKELDALEAQIRNIQNLEDQRAGKSGTSALAAGTATGQEGVSNTMTMIGGSGALEGFGKAKEGFKEFRDEQRKGFKEFKKTSGFWGTWSKRVSLSFGTASVGARLFGAALMNAIPIIGQVLFFGGLLISFLGKFKGEASEAEKAQIKLTQTVDTSKEKFEQLAETNSKLNETLDKLDDSIRAVAISATALKNEITVTAGVAAEARINFENMTDAIDDQKTSRFALRLKEIGERLKGIGTAITTYVITALQYLFPLLTAFINKLIDLGVIDSAKEKMKAFGEGVQDVFSKDKSIGRAEKFKQAINDASSEIERLKGTNELMARALEGFDPAAMYKELEQVIHTDVGPVMLTFEEATEKVNAAFREQTKDVETVSQTLKDLSTNLQEVGKVFNKNIDSILKRNAFDKIADTVVTLNEGFENLQDSPLLSDDQIMEQLRLASETAGIDVKEFGVSLESVRESLEKGEKPFETLETNLRQLAEQTRTNAQDKKDLAEQLRSVNDEFKNSQALAEYTAKLENFKKTGKLEIGVVDNFDLQIESAEKAAQLAEDTAKIKKEQIDAEYALEIFKLNVFKTKYAEGSAEREELEGILDQIEAFKTLRKDRIDDQKEREKDAAKLTKLATISTAGTKGTLGERASVVGTALSIQDEEADLTIAKIQAVQNAMEPMLDSLKSLGPEGEAVATAFTGIMTIAQAFKQAGDEGLSTSEKIEAVGTMISAVSAIMQANSKAQIAEIDNQIKAEKARDGKSKESLAKIAGFEKKKEALARKNFEMNKKLQIAQAVASTASAVVGALGKKPWGYENIALAAMMAVMGAAQVAIIRKQQFQGGSSDTGPSVPSTIEVGKRNNKVDVSRGATAGEIGFLRGAKGIGTSANDFTGAAAGMKRGYASGGEIMVGERGPEIITPVTPMQVTPNDKIGGTTNVNFSINAVDAAGVEDLLVAQRGNIIGMIREAANEHGEEFMEEVNIGAY